MDMPNKLYVDDVRPLPDTGYWVLATTFHEAICLLENNNFDEVSLDHDLGCYYGNREMTGHDILNWLIDRKINNKGWVPSVVRVHSANSAKSGLMRIDIESYWGINEEHNSN